MSVKILLKILVVFFGCLSFSSVLAYDQTPLKKAITNFAKDEPTSFSLGAFPPVHSKNVDIVLSHKVEATPLLLKALHSDNWLVVAQSTYCLELLKVTGARSKMIELENKWDSLPKTSSAHEIMVRGYARERIESYLRREKEKFKED